MSSSSSPAHLLPRDCPSSVAQPVNRTAPPPQGLAAVVDLLPTAMIEPGPQLLAGEQTAGETTEQSEAMEVDEVLSTEEQVVAQFADGGPAAACRDT